uniref:Polysaccharide pyruvyl transferase domain-containing protein n=1 Tax=uncultured Alphaproteobacteria bacterium TaxID=91750 RepID=A0A6G8F306_9PROT|nr:hypothetical protein PlAlph_5610 [uncultured Alphaproteobacteria bacterium]
MTTSDNNIEKYDCAILNFWCYSNYGAVMTGYALQKALEEMGYSNRLILYMNKAMRRHHEDYFSESHFKKFSDKYIKSTKLYMDADLSELNKITDTFIVGSDQVWRTNLQGVNKWAYYLNFADVKAKKIACAASFGLNEFIGDADDEMTARFWLKHFDAVSVREFEAGEFCSQRLGVDNRIVVDPVFYINRSHYDAMADTTAPKAPKEYILAYFLGTSDDDRRVINAYSQKLGMPVIELKVNETTTEEWLYYIKHAKLVLTNSFHGVCFSIIFNREFICIANRDKAYPRFTTILGKAGLSERALPSSEFTQCLDIDKAPIDYAAVEEKLFEERKFALDWLAQAMKAPKKETMSETDELLKAFSNRMTIMQCTYRDEMSLIRDVLNYGKLKRRYRKCRLRYLFSWGKRHKEYKIRKKELKNRLRNVRSFIKNNK